MNSFFILQYTEKVFVRRTDENLSQLLLESVCANDKKAVYQHIVKSGMDVNAISGKALSGISSCPRIQLQNSFWCFLCWKIRKSWRIISCCAGDLFRMVSLSNLSISSQSENKLTEDIQGGSSVIHLACLTSDAGMVELLLQHGADINACDSRGRAPIHYCIIRGKTAAAKVLIMRYCKHFQPWYLYPNSPYVMK